MTGLSKLVKPLVWEPNRVIGFHAFCPLFGTVHYVDDTAGAKDDDAKRAAIIVAALDPEALARWRDEAVQAEREACAVTLSELVQTVGDNAVEILLRNEPDANELRRQSVRQAYTQPIRRMIPKKGGEA
jgi:hypothetical protein